VTKRKNNAIFVRLEGMDLDAIDAYAKREGFVSVSAFARWLIAQEMKEGGRVPSEIRTVIREELAESLKGQKVASSQ
jgi:hypothetical protein